MSLINYDIDINDIISGEKLEELCDIILITQDIFNYHQSLNKNLNMIFVDDNNIDIDKIKKSNIIFIYTHIFDIFINSILPLLDTDKCYKIVTHNSDRCINEQYKKLLDNYNIILYSQNVDMDHPKLFSIPIGIANNQWAHGNLTTLYNTIQRSKKLLFNEKKDKIYVNFDINTNRAIRFNIMENLKKNKLSYITNGKDYYNYLNELFTFKWVACPRGNGIDIHRLWETLYLGCIPLVDKNINTLKYNDLPLIYIDDWSQINYEFLIDRTNKILDNINSYNYEKLFLKYWINLFKT